ncbi:hypothetical protein MTR_4g093880 [Medicago truncatula]|uniref:Uncharacterized protein n=1 Tax=Medicago truncatula TaxID=3880 RepID=G7JV67_MEDTR|nr:hypothetical protein MTR_4g093880 [Medicago truncatula]
MLIKILKINDKSQLNKQHTKKEFCGCWDSSPGLHGHNVEFLPLNYSHMTCSFRGINNISN